MARPAARVALSIVGRPLCVPCIAARTRVNENAVKSYLAVMRESLAVFREHHARCPACGAAGNVFSLTRSAMNPLELRAQIRAKVADGRLPSDAQVQVRTEPLRAARCAACDELIVNNEAAVECVAGEQTYCLHLECMYVWYLERAPGPMAVPVAGC